MRRPELCVQFDCDVDSLVSDGDVPDCDVPDGDVSNGDVVEPVVEREPKHRTSQTARHRSKYYAQKELLSLRAL